MLVSMGRQPLLLGSALGPSHRAQHAEHLYVLLPVLDDRKHYWIGPHEIDKLLRRGGDWLGSHPESELISRRYLRFGGLAREALARLAETGEDTDQLDEHQDEAEQAAERPISLGEQRLASVLEAVRMLGGGRVVDLGCGEGRLLQRLVAEPSVAKARSSQMSDLDPVPADSSAQSCILVTQVLPSRYCGSQRIRRCPRQEPISSLVRPARHHSRCQGHDIRRPHGNGQHLQCQERWRGRVRVPH